MSEQTTETSESAEIMNGKNVVTGKCPSLASRFRGCMLGSLIGDCLGQPFEGEERPISKSVLNSYFEKLHDSNLKGDFKNTGLASICCKILTKQSFFSILAPYKAYTDDTAMTFSVAQSLINKNRFDPQDMAKK